MTETPSIGADATARLGTDVFISYAREDRPFVGRLHDVLASEGLRAWVDWEGIPASAKWMVEVRAAIDQADVFCFVISPNSVESSVCREEAAHAAAGGKRIVPVLCHEVNEGLVPEIVAAHNWIDFTDRASFDEAFATLTRAIAIDPEYVREHTKLLVRAKEWDAAHRDRSKLLRGAELNDAEIWLADAEDKNPRPTATHSAYVLASSRAASRRQRTRVVAVVGVLVLSLVLSGIALVQRNAARRAQVDAESRALAASSLLQAEQDPELSLILAVKAAETAKTDAAYDALRRSIGVANLADNVTESIAPNALALSRDGTVLAVAGADRSGRPSISVRSVDGFDIGTERIVQLDGAEAQDVAVTEDGGLAAVSDVDGSIWLVDLADGHVLQHGKFHAAPDWSALGFSASGRELLVAGKHGLIGVDTATWRAETIAEVEIRSPFRVDLQLTPDGRNALLAGNHGLHVFDLTGTGHDRVLETGNPVTSVSLNGSGSTVAAGIGGTYAKLWSTSDWKPVGRIAPGVSFDIAALSTDGSSVYLSDISGGGTLWDVQLGVQIADLIGHEGGIVGAVFSRAGDALYTASYDGTIRVWRVTGREPEAAVSGDFLVGINRGASVIATRELRDNQYFNYNRELVVFRDGSGELLSRVDVNTRRANAGACVGDSFADVGGFFGPSPLGVPISDDGSLAVIPSSQGSCVLLVHPKTGAIVSVLDLGQVTGHPVSSVNAWPTGDGSSLIAAVDPGTGASELWNVDVESGKGVWHMRYATDTPLIVGDVGPTGKTAAIADDSSLTLVDMARGTVVCRAELGRNNLLTGDVAVGVTGQVAAASVSGVRLFDGSCRDITPGVLASDDRAYTSLAYSSNGLFLAARAQDDAALRFWDVGTGSLVYQVPAQGWFLAFEGDGDSVLTGHLGVRRYPCEPCGPFDKLLELARSRVTRELTPLEQQTYLGGSRN